MIAEEYLGRSRLFRRLKNGSHGQLIERYAARLVELGLARYGTWRSLHVVGGLLSWIAASRSALTDLDECMVDRLPLPRQDSLPAGWLAFTGRELNPLDCGERFPSCYISSPFPGFILTQGSHVPLHEIAAAIPAARDGVVLNIDRYSHIYWPTAADAREFC